LYTFGRKTFGFLVEKQIAFKIIGHAHPYLDFERAVFHPIVELNDAPLAHLQLGTRANAQGDLSDPFKIGG
jgi:hypothetical protein